MRIRDVTGKFFCVSCEYTGFAAEFQEPREKRHCPQCGETNGIVPAGSARSARDDVDDWPDDYEDDEAYYDDEDDDWPDWHDEYDA